LRVRAPPLAMSLTYLLDQLKDASEEETKATRKKVLINYVLEVNGHLKDFSFAETKEFLKMLNSLFCEECGSPEYISCPCNSY